MTTAQEGQPIPDEERADWMAILAQADPAELEAALAGLGEVPAHVWLRKPELGSAMIRGRAGGSGMRFNLGEMTVTRCTLRLEDGPTGTAYVAGRSKRHAELAALFDALLQEHGRRESLMRSVIDPLREARRARQRKRLGKAASTRVEFFTVAREGVES